jgi:iron-sulfur cluster insertion protein
MNILSEQDLQLTGAASDKMVELISQVDGEIAGIRVYSQAGGCSGMSFGMTFSERVEENDLVRESAGFKVIVAADTIDHIRGTEMDYVDSGNGQPSFVFNNVPEPVSTGGCGSCGSQGSCG